jgi:hypothetical protein
MTFLVYNHFTGFIILSVKKDTPEECYRYVSTIYGTHFIPLPKFFSRFA